MSADPGWYPDPHESSQLRYWDGARWTDHHQPLPPAPVDLPVETTVESTEETASEVLVEPPIVIVPPTGELTPPEHSIPETEQPEPLMHELEPVASAATVEHRGAPLPGWANSGPPPETAEPEQSLSTSRRSSSPADVTRLVGGLTIALAVVVSMWSTWSLSSWLFEPERTFDARAAIGLGASAPLGSVVEVFGEAGITCSLVAGSGSLDQAGLRSQMERGRPDVSGPEDLGTYPTLLTQFDRVLDEVDDLEPRSNYTLLQCGDSQVVSSDDRAYLIDLRSDDSDLRRSLRDTGALVISTT